MTTPAQPPVTPFSLWWGLAGIAGLMALVLLVAPYSDHIAFLPDTGFSWYYWKLPEPTLASQLSAWLGYSLHQISMWAVIYHAQKSSPRYVDGLHRFNVMALAINGFFIIIHIVQTKVWYDGLAQNTSVFSSQASVVLLLVMVLLMEHQRRGLFFGKPTPILKTAVDESGSFIKKYHGYYFCWAITYTFWFHPIETTLGHLFGTTYTLMILLQGSLFFTRFHVNRRWTMLLEVTVLFHGAMVAYLSSQNNAGQFLFGFLAIFVITQMHGVNWTRVVRWGVAMLSVIGMLAYYHGDWMRMLAEVPRIPVAEYVIAIALAGMIYLPLKLFRERQNSRKVS